MPIPETDRTIELRFKNKRTKFIINEEDWPRVESYFNNKYLETIPENLHAETEIPPIEELILERAIYDLSKNIPWVTYIYERHNVARNERKNLTKLGYSTTNLEDIS